MYDCLEQMSGLTQVPALNRWMSVEPVIADFAFHANCHNLLTRCMLRAQGRQGQFQDDDGEISEDAQLGVPTNEQDHYARMNRRRDARWVRFLKTPHSRITLLIWLVLAQPLMIMHYIFSNIA